ncbi:MAG: repair protein RadC protein [candidate division WS6 bacterium GW2011_GWC2_36_7]|uniref:Repair protein RadC protein n=1 Tax=candidate division WS6 bacterium GW2011_GWC2_36_7 TaxID=1619091 RepID=A0A0G0HI31_9BACT|nr:MAG: repair protein RadC protein [candidate division WS6 bacterium GW2011_GWC2_36_7]
MLPREKYLERGIDSLSDMELIAIIIGSGIKGHDFMSVSRSVVYRIRKSIKKNGYVDIKDIVDILGIGLATAMKILSGIELGRRLYDLGSREKTTVSNSQEAYYLLKGMGSKKQEYIVGLFLNSRFELLEQRTLAIGTVDGAGLLPRDVIIPALELNASSVILAHNHPSGDPLPSDEDFAVTQRVGKALDLVGMKLLDHMVIGRESWKSIC